MMFSIEVGSDAPAGGMTVITGDCGGSGADSQDAERTPIDAAISGMKSLTVCLRTSCCPRQIGSAGCVYEFSSVVVLDADQ